MVTLNAVFLERLNQRIERSQGAMSSALRLAADFLANRGNLDEAITYLEAEVLGVNMPETIAIEDLKTVLFEELNQAARDMTALSVFSPL